MSTINIVEVQRRLTAMQFPIEHEEQVTIRCAAERDVVINNLAALWFSLGHWLEMDEVIRQDADLMRLMISTHAVEGITLLHKLRRENLLLIGLNFMFTFECWPVAYMPELKTFLRRWSTELSCAHPDINAMVIYHGRNQEHPWFSDYEGHDSSPSVLVSSTTSARRFTATTE